MATLIEETAKIHIGLLADYEIRSEYSKIILKNASGETQSFEFDEEVRLYHPTKDELMMLVLQENGNLLVADQILICLSNEDKISYYERLGVEELPAMLRLFDRRKERK